MGIERRVFCILSSLFVTVCKFSHIKCLTFDFLLDPPTRIQVSKLQAPSRAYLMLDVKYTIDHLFSLQYQFRACELYYA